MKGFLHLLLIFLALIYEQGYANDSLRARIYAYDWASLEAQLSSDAVTPREPEDRADYKGLKRDTGYFLAYQIATIGILYLMPEGISGWSKESKESYSFRQWEENVSHPSWDKDDYFINYVLHPYWGAAYYVRARQRNLDRTQSFWYSVLLSTLYEYGVEALFEEPSIQDLVVTPIGAVVLGEYFFKTHKRIRDRHLDGSPITRKDRWMLFLTDPLGALNSKVRKLSGQDAELTLRPFAVTKSLERFSPYKHISPVTEAPQTIVGVELKLRF